MAPRLGRTALLAAAAALVVLASGCARIRDHQGHVLDADLATAIQPGVDNRESVTGTLGRPTFTGQFDQRDWYYLSRNTRQAAFTMPRPVDQTLLHIRFDEQGNVASIERTGLELVARIQPMEDKTPTLGRDRSFFEELFSNVGQVGSLPTQGGGSGP